MLSEKIFRGDSSWAVGAENDAVLHCFPSRILVGSNIGERSQGEGKKMTRRGVFGV